MRNKNIFSILVVRSNIKSLYDIPKAFHANKTLWNCIVTSQPSYTEQIGIMHWNRSIIKATGILLNLPRNTYKLPASELPFTILVWDEWNFDTFLKTLKITPAAFEILFDIVRIWELNLRLLSLTTITSFVSSADENVWEVPYSINIHTTTIIIACI